MSDSLLRCAGVTKRFGNVVAVDGVDLTLERSRIMALLGPSGCGKTTLLRLLAGFEQPDAGTIEIGGKMLAGPGVAVAPEKRRVGLVFQEYALFNHLSVERNVRFGLPKGSRRERVDELLEVVGLAGYGKRMPHELSGGQQQRVALARTLAAEPELVLLDEPFSNLDPGLRTQVRDEVWQILDSQGTTAIIVTHDQEEALSLPGDVAVMMNGKIMQAGSARDVYERPASREVAVFVGDANVLAGEAEGDSASTELGRISLRSQMRGDADIVVRPENIVFTEGRGVEAHVVRREYYGHDQLVTLRLPSGLLVRARTPHFFDVSPGDTCAIEVHEPATAFPR